MNVNERLVSQNSVHQIALDEFAVKYLLTPRQLEVFEKVIERKTNKEIAGELFIGTRCVEDHLCQVYVKLSVDNRTSAILLAMTNGIITENFGEP